LLLYVDVFNLYKNSHGYLINFTYMLWNGRVWVFFCFLYRCRYLYTILYATQYLNVKMLRTYYWFCSMICWYYVCINM